MATVSERIGSRQCPLCTAPLVVRKNAAGTVTMACNGADGCDFSGFAKKGTKAARLLAPETAPAAPAAPAPRKPASAFNLADL